MTLPLELVVTLVVGAVGGAGALFTALMRMSDRLSKVEALMSVLVKHIGLKEDDA